MTMTTSASTPRPDAVLGRMANTEPLQPGSMAESFAKARAADVVVSLSRVPAHLWRPIRTPRRMLTDGARRYRRRLAILRQRKKHRPTLTVRISKNAAN